MREIPPPSPAVVVGIDGSREAIGAALWAVREAVDRDLPLRLVSAIEPKASIPGDGQTYLQDFATAECAILRAVTAVESTCEPVKIEAEIVRSTAGQALLIASPTAVMVCIGAVGEHTATGIRRGGSTATARSARAHCPVAIIRGSAPRSGGHPGWIVTCADGDPGDAFVVARPVEEARLRSAPLRILREKGRPHRDDVRHARSTEASLKNLERSIARWRLTNPGLVIESVEVSDDPFDEIARHAHDAQLIVVGHGRGRSLVEVNRKSMTAQVLDLPCSVLVAEPHRAL